MAKVKALLSITFLGLISSLWIFQNSFRYDKSDSFLKGNVHWILKRIGSRSQDNGRVQASSQTTSWKDGWKLWKEEQENRQNVLKEVCGRSGLTQEELQDILMLRSQVFLQNLLVDDKRKAIYCFIFKVASSNWKKLWMALTGLADVKNFTSVPLKLAHESTSRMKLVTNTKIEYLQTKLQTYTKLIVVRNPFHRIASAYRDKIQGDFGATFTQKEVLPYVMKRKYGANLTNIEWTEFVDFLTFGKGQNREHHWKSYTSLCHPCAINYDVIAKFETLEEDSERFLRLINAPEDLHFPNTSRTARRIDSALWKDYQKQLTKKQVDALYKAYQKDFQMFEYD
ncbi:carbohydrate sulfotransferase 9-like [Palaemon carinicauda]|uniref:carbohydrate sulfotransferase 9-like n=1 Tax=Palaemon carinicauda TaxID=392227 RepID=UPI0035B689DE